MKLAPKDLGHLRNDFGLLGILIIKFDILNL